MTDKKCLIVSHTEDYTTDIVVDNLNKKGLEYFRLNTDKQDFSKFSVSIIKNNVQNPLATINSIWYRRVKSPIISNSGYIQNFFQNEFKIFLNNLFAMQNIKWLSNPFSIERAENKLLQLQAASAVGLQVPNTLVTSDVNEVTHFQERFKDIIIKPLSSNYYRNSESEYGIYTRRLSKQMIKNWLENADQYANQAPAIFQEFIQKKIELRIIVIDKKVFSAKIVAANKSNEEIVDWRKEDVSFKKYDIDKNIQQKLIQLLEKMNIHFGAIDMVIDKYGNYFLLEINPNGQWGWLELDCKLNISDAIINFLYQ